MSLTSLTRQLLSRIQSSNSAALNKMPTRSAVTTVTGSFLEEPQTVRMGLMFVTLTVIPGILIGATISKNLAKFLEENDLFIADDDDD